MLTMGTTGVIYIAVEPQDGRKGIDGLAGVVRTTLGRDPGSGDLFVFKNRRGDKLKILAWMGNGFFFWASPFGPACARFRTLGRFATPRSRA